MGTLHYLKWLQKKRLILAKLGLHVRAIETNMILVVTMMDCLFLVVTMQWSSSDYASTFDHGQVLECCHCYS